MYQIEINFSLIALILLHISSTMFAIWIISSITYLNIVFLIVVRYRIWELPILIIT